MKRTLKLTIVYDLPEDEDIYTPDGSSVVLEVKQSFANVDIEATVTLDNEYDE